MKKIVLLLGLFTAFSFAQAQLLKKLKDKVDKQLTKQSMMRQTERKMRKEVGRQVAIQVTAIKLSRQQ